MNAGVRTVPWGVEISPRRAAPSSARARNEKASIAQGIARKRRRRNRIGAAKHRSHSPQRMKLAFRRGPQARAVSRLLFLAWVVRRIEVVDAYRPSNSRGLDDRLSV